MALVFKRTLHSSALRQGPNPFFHLQALSNARETARATQLSKLPRTAHSPQLQLLQAEASLTPLAGDGASRSGKDPKTVVNLAKADSLKSEVPKATSGAPKLHAVNAPPKMDDLVNSPDYQGKLQVAKEVQKMRQELGEWQASVDDKLALLSYNVKVIQSRQGPSGWLVAVGAFFFICSWAATGAWMNSVAERKVPQAAPPPIVERPKKAIPPKPKPRPHPKPEEQEMQKPTKAEKIVQSTPVVAPQAQVPQSKGWFW